MSRTIFSLFKNYCSQLAKLELIVATKVDVVAIEDTVLKSTLTQKVMGFFSSTNKVLNKYACALYV